MYQTADHQIVPMTVGGKPTMPLLQANDTAKLAALGIFRHYTLPGHAPLGYTDWAESSDENGTYYWCEPAGTAAEIAAALTEQRRRERHGERTMRRLAAQTGGFAFAGATYASDLEESIPLLTNAAISAQMALAQGPEAAAAFGAALGDGWRDTTGTGRITTAEGILSLHAAFVSHGAACDRHSQSLKAAIDAAQSVEELDAIDLTAGWPA
jgi:hypothetical protein